MEQHQVRNGNGNGVRFEVLKWLMTLALAGLVSYMTATGQIQSQIAAIKATSEAQFGEVLRRMEMMQQDIREIRNRDR